MSVYPEFEWEVTGSIIILIIKFWKFSEPQDEFWKVKEEQRKYLEWLRVKLNIKNHTDWYNVNEDMVRENRGAGYYLFKQLAHFL